MQTNLSWVVTEVGGILEIIKQIMLRDDLIISQKILALAYIADLPMTTLFGCIAGTDVDKQQNELIQSIVELFDQLTKMNLVIDRDLGSCSAGKLNPKPYGEAAEIRNELSKQYPSFDWTRRWQAIDLFLNKTLKNTKFERN